MATSEAQSLAHYDITPVLMYPIDLGIGEFICGVAATSGGKLFTVRNSGPALVHGYEMATGQLLAKGVQRGSGNGQLECLGNHCACALGEQLVVSDDVCIAGHERDASRFQLFDADLRWQRSWYHAAPTSEFMALASHGSMLYVATHTSVYCYDGSTGTLTQTVHLASTSQRVGLTNSHYSSVWSDSSN